MKEVLTVKSMKKPTARRLPSGAWTCRVRVGGKDHSITGYDRASVEQEAMGIKYGLINAKKKVGPMTVTEAIDAYIESRKSSLSPSTMRSYKGSQKHQLQGLMDKKIDSLTDRICQKAIDDDKATCSPKTIKNAWSLVASAVREQTGQEFTVHLPTVIKNEHPFLQPEQIPIFLDALRDTPAELPALLGLHSLRRSEILGLTWENVDLKNGLLYIRGATVFNEDGTLVHKKENKNAASRRVVPIMIDRLKELLEAQERTKKFVVTTHPNSIFAQVNRVCTSAGLPEIGVHGLRHSFCSLAYHLDMSEGVAMKVGGWADYATMRKIYTHIADKDIAASVQVMRDFYNPKNDNENDNKNSE